MRCYKGEYNMSIKISVILTVYNTGSYLAECMDSILQQSMQDFELICIDDGSKDYSLEILHTYKQQDERVTVYAMPENKGVSYCRNYGLTLAKGKYVILLDSDDIFQPTMLQELYEMAEQDNSDIVICNSIKYDDVLKEKLYMKDSLRMDYLKQTRGFHYSDCTAYIFNFCKGWAWDKLYRREFIEKYQLQFPVLKNTEDAVFVYQSLLLADRISALDSILIIHRIRRSDSVSSKRDNSFYEFEAAMQLLKGFLKERNLFDIVAESYGNLVVNLGLWYLNTLQEEDNYKAMYDMLHAKLFFKVQEQCGLCNWKDFYNKADYYQFKQVLNKPYSEKQRKKIKLYYKLMRGMKSLQENGLGYWMRRGIGILN